MKRTGNLFDRIANRNNLRDALGKALRGKHARPEARLFSMDLEDRLRWMSDGIHGETLPLRKYRQFIICDPKRRTITAPCFVDRVLHHAIMNVCEPVFERWLIHDTYACRVGRGRVAALLRARHFAERHPFFLRMDVRKYFESISHEALFERLQRLFKDSRLLRLFERIIASYHTEDRRGLPIGSLTSQHFANFYLGWFDRFVRETLRARGYVRYMDDMLFWCDSVADARTALLQSKEFLGNSLRLQLKATPYIDRSCHGVDFLGCRVFPDRLELNRRSRLRFRRKLAKLETDYSKGGIGEGMLQVKATSLVAFTRSAGAMSWRFRRAVLQCLPVSGRWPRTG